MFPLFFVPVGLCDDALMRGCVDAIQVSLRDGFCFMPAEPVSEHANSTANPHKLLVTKYLPKIIEKANLENYKKQQKKKSHLMEVTNSQRRAPKKTRFLMNPVYQKSAKSTRDGVPSLIKWRESMLIMRLWKNWQKLKNCTKKAILLLALRAVFAAFGERAQRAITK